MDPKAAVEFAVEYGRKLGARYCEARYQRDVKVSVILKNGEPEPPSYSRESGLGIRAVVDGGLAFTSTNILEKEEVEKAVAQAVKAARAASQAVRKWVEFSEEDFERANYTVEFMVNPVEVELEEQLRLLKHFDQLAISSLKEAKLPGRLISYDGWWTEKIYMNSDGAYVESWIPRVSIFLFLTAFHPEKGTAQRFFQLGEAGGWERINAWKLDEQVQSETKALEKALMEGVKVEDGIYDVILGSEVVGLLCHEASGHPQEADRILGREAAQAGESYLKPEMLGRKIGSEHVTIIDDPTLPHSYGYYLYDDEGVKARPRYLIKEGIINELLHNRQTASIFKVKSNAAARASAYDREPIVRMSNTYFKPGDWSLEELLQETKRAIWIKSFEEWNIDDIRWNNRYVGLEAYLVENGEPTKTLRDPVLEATTEKIFTSVDAVARELEFQAATCGKGDPMQGVPVWTGGPPIRLRNIRVFSR